MGLNICELSGISIPTFSTLSESIPPPAKRLDEHWQSQALQCLEWLGLAYIKAKRYIMKENIDPCKIKTCC